MIQVHNEPPKINNQKTKANRCCSASPCAMIQKIFLSLDNLNQIQIQQ